MTPRHGNTFLDCAALNPRMPPSAERMQDALNDICQCGGSYRFNEHTDDCRKEAAAMAVWNSPATPTGRSKQR